MCICGRKRSDECGERELGCLWERRDLYRRRDIKGQLFDILLENESDGGQRLDGGGLVSGYCNW